jgi:uncharacterized membrane protein
MVFLLNIRGRHAGSRLIDTGHMNLSGTTRLEAFGDGVFAIAITLPALEITVPGAAELRQDGGLWPPLGPHGHSYLGYALSFLIIGVMWASHHALCQHIRRTDRGLILANLNAYTERIEATPTLADRESEA